MPENFAGLLFMQWLARILLGFKQLLYHALQRQRDAPLLSYLRKCHLSLLKLS